MFEIAALRDAVDRVVTADPADLTDAALAADLLALARERDRLDAAFARLAYAAHVRGVGLIDGAKSTAAWLRRHARMREGDARGAIEAGAACEVLARTGDAWRAGEISSGAARTIAAARVDGHDDTYRACEPEFLRFARDHDFVRLRRVCMHYRNCVYADGRAPHIPDGFTASKTYDGAVIVHGEFRGLAAETLMTALHAYMDPPSEGDSRTTAERRAAAEVRIHEVALAHAPEGRRRQAQVTVVVDYETLTGGAVGRTDGQFTGPLPRHDVERLLCDASVSRVIAGPDSMPLDVGRSSRTVPPALRRAVGVRDGGCAVSGCDRPPGWCDVHHVVPWSEGGPTALDNLALVCDHHHSLVHRPGWHAKLEGHVLTIFRPDGARMAGRRYAEPNDPRERGSPW